MLLSFHFQVRWLTSRHQKPSQAPFIFRLLQRRSCAKQVQHSQGTTSSCFSAALPGISIYLLEAKSRNRVVRLPDLRISIKRRQRIAARCRLKLSGHAFTTWRLPVMVTLPLAEQAILLPLCRYHCSSTPVPQNVGAHFCFLHCWYCKVSCFHPN